MPKRKNRPDKYGASTVPKKPSAPSNEEHDLIERLKTWEHAEPYKDHYVGWSDMAAADKLRKKGYLVQGPALGCFYVTQAFRDAFMTVSERAL